MMFDWLEGLSTILRNLVHVHDTKSPWFPITIELLVLSACCQCFRGANKAMQSSLVLNESAC